MKNNINKTVLQTLFYSLVIYFFIGQGDLFAQDNNDFQWIWAKSGGSGGKVHNEASYYLKGTSGEMIFDIATDNDNNYYFLANISTYLANIDGMPIYSPGKTSDNSYHATSKNLLIMSFTCDGQYRWHKTIGSGTGGYIQTLALDNQGGLYVSAKLNNPTIEKQTNYGVPPLCFSEDNCLAEYSNSYNFGEWTQDPYMPHEGWKEGFLLKYNTDNGDFVWRRDFQGLVTVRTGAMIICGGVQIDSNNILHNIVALRKGVHLDGAIVIDDEDEFKYHYYLIKYDTNGNLVAPPLLLPMTGYTNPTVNIARFKMKYNEALNRYYIAGYYSASASDITLSFNGYNFWQLPPDSYSIYGVIFSFTPDDLDNWWHKELFRDESNSTGSNYTFINDIVIDDNSDIYILGTVEGTSGLVTYFGDFAIVPPPGKMALKMAFVMKTNALGDVQWVNVPESGSGAIGWDLAINGNELIGAFKGDHSLLWQGHTTGSTQQGLWNPMAIRFNKHTGDIINSHTIKVNGALENILTAVQTDRDGNYIVGGVFREDIFTDNPNGIPKLKNTVTSAEYSDFFIARLAATECDVANNLGASKNIYQSQIMIYPNPATDKIYIQTQENIQSYQIYNLLGQQVLHGNIDNNNEIDLHKLSDGTYLIKLKTQTGDIITKKIVKVK